MKFYIAARTSQKEQVREIYRKLKRKGHEISNDWTRLPLKRPYEENFELAKRSIEEISEAIKNSDVVVLISDEAGIDMYGEFGEAIMSNMITGKPLNYVIGDYLNKSILFFHLSVNRRKTIEEVLTDFD